jgi:uncharacterized membrane protein
MTRWTTEQLDDLPRSNDFRLRGLEMTRLEAFTDAAFAFAITMLIISQAGIPSSVSDLLGALKDIPAFLASFAAIASFWYAHRQWSRYFGLEDGVSILISLGLIFVMLVFVFPLKMVFSAMFNWFTGGWLPTSFELESVSNLPVLFVIYGLGFTAVSSLIGLLYYRTLRMADRLALDPLERLRTRQQITSFGVMAVTGFVSCLWAGLLPHWLGVWSGFWYCTLPVSMPILAIVHERQAKKIHVQSLDA